MTSNAEKPNFFLYHDTGNPLCEEHSVLAPQHYVRKFHNLDSLFYKHIEHFGDFFWNASKEFGEKWAPVEKSAQEGYVGIKVLEPFIKKDACPWCFSETIRKLDCLYAELDKFESEVSHFETKCFSIWGLEDFDPNDYWYEQLRNVRSVVERRLFESILDFSVDDQESEVAYG